MNTSMEPNQSASPSRNLGQWMRQHPLFSYFFIAYAGTWIFLIPSILSVWGIVKGDFKLTQILSIFVGPFLAAILMTCITEGQAGMLLLRQRIKQSRFGWQWYLLILVGIPALILLGVIIQPGVLASFKGLTSTLLVSYPVYFVVTCFAVGLPEEIGWRGFALPRMQPRYGPLGGTLLLGVLWVFWHLPRFLLPEHGGGPGTGWANFFTNFSYFFLMVMALAIILTWVINHTHASIFAAILVHTAVDTPTLVWTPLFLAVNETRFLLATVIAFVVPALLILILTRGRLGYQPGQEQPLEPVGSVAQPNL
jgi:membrane protease YdiL (CAAX protease family)